MRYQDGGMQMDHGHQIYSFTLDGNAHKLVAIRHVGRKLEVNVRLAADIVLDDQTTVFDDVLDPEFRPDEHGLVVEWKQPMIPGWDWLTFSRWKRF